MRQSIQEYLDVPSHWPVKENIKHEIVLMPNKHDIKTANKGDPLSCALHNTACRVFGVPNCAIGGRWAYIPQRDHKGKHYIARMAANRETQKALALFDKTGEMPEGGFIFRPISESQKYAKKRAYMKKWNKGEVGGTGKKRPGQKKRRVKSRSLPMSIRT